MFLPAPSLRAVTAAVLAILIWSTTALAEPSASITHPDLAKALAYFERGDYARAAADLPAIIKTENLTPAELQRAQEALGISHYVLGRLLDARRVFAELIRTAPLYQPDALYVAPEIVAFVADVRASQSSSSPVTGAPLQVLPSPIVMAPASPLTSDPNRAPLAFSNLDLLPFGIGQFRQKRTARGVSFAAFQTAFLAANAGLYYYRKCNLKDSCAAAYYPEKNVRQAQQLQVLQIASGAVFLAIAVGGVADAVAYSLDEGERITLLPIGRGVGLAWKVP